MKRFEFSLDRLLKVKRQLERLAELEQLQARTEVEKSRATLQEQQEQLDRVAGRLTTQDGRSTTVSPHQWAAVADLSRRIGESIEESERVVTTAEQRLAAASQERATVAMEVEALTTLREQQWTQWRREAQLADQDRLDEQGLRRWMAAQSQAPEGDQSS
jgi:flagellar protein FliJ